LRNEGRSIVYVVSDEQRHRDAGTKFLAGLPRGNGGFRRDQSETFKSQLRLDV
jgi:hypothetical protein